MGLFNKKKGKKEEDFDDSVDFSKSNLEKLMPDLPELPNNTQNKGSNFPSYDSEINSIKRQVEGVPKEMDDIPIRKPKMKAQNELGIPNNTGFKPNMPQLQLMPTNQIRPVAVVQQPRVMGGMVGAKPIFIKIDKYRDALNNLENIKELCRNADNLLGEINRLREEENAELEKWRSDIGKIKDKLLSVDKKLFEG